MLKQYSIFMFCIWLFVGCIRMSDINITIDEVVGDASGEWESVADESAKNDSFIITRDESAVWLGKIELPLLTKKRQFETYIWCSSTLLETHGNEIEFELTYGMPNEDETGFDEWISWTTTKKGSELKGDEWNLLCSPKMIGGTEWWLQIKPVGKSAAFVDAIKIETKPKN